MKTIEIKGIGIPNKGAELMLASILEALHNSKEEIRFVVEPNSSYMSRSKYCLYQKASLTIKNKTYDLSKLFQVIPKKLRLKYGIIVDSEIDVILDASGFAYGDQWGYQKAEQRLANRIGAWKKRGKKVILMPQAFGPFNDSRLRSAALKILENADLVFARDKVSLRSLDEILPGKAVLSPDFTNAITPPPPNHCDLSGYYSRPCFIPNSKMVSMGESDRNSYTRLFADAINLLKEKGHSPYLLIHEGEGDIKLAQKISQLSQDTEILILESPIDIKYIIGKSLMLVSSRFHGLVSGLSQGVPCIATGWSHKYKELMADYEMSHLSIQSKDAEHFLSSVLSISESSENQKLREILLAHAKSEKEKTYAMWEKVKSLIIKA
ncbi:polysaccharide pyruvyl transferase family protein [Halopseudomonas sp.]|uniref:polysaccharide pyruvyl transferase family protein n=1 Tax=Halopseudomonas sp. TaxID=2901191 RepID=UPI0030018939